MENIINLSIQTLCKYIRNRYIKSIDVVNAYLTRIKKYDLKLQAFTYINEVMVLLTAEEIDKKIRMGIDIEILSGIPIAIKDNIMIKNEQMTSASKYLLKYISPYDATVIKKIKNADGIILGRTNMDEFAMGCTTETSFYQKTTNPWNTQYIPGGSSGGSAVAVSSGMAPFALGTDTGGSVRQPASFCGIVGYKPSYGLISRYGICALASSFDQVGTLTKTVQDTILLAKILIDYDSLDPTSEKSNINFSQENNICNPKKITIGIPKQIINYNIEQDILSLFNESIKKMESIGVTIVEVDIPAYKYVSALYKVLMCAEVSSNIAAFDGVRYGYRYPHVTNLDNEYSRSRGMALGYEVKKRILFGTYMLGSKNYQKYYYKAQQIRTILINQIHNAYKLCNFIFSPSVLQMPVKLGQTLHDECDIFLIVANLAGLPGITVPYGFTKSLGMPVGVHFMGSRFADMQLLQMAKVFETVAGFNTYKYPEIH
ncbi:MAG: Asp-tRNA(Asn)/Glu-tRNA(Gln) amidotransferase subunit GatA [Endomicrobium sp.]|jgi:aspartyl-tRNA(Asn)/glutamyl-tRNA(Gln) amidotransferase subunit A|nr:Asp-tRNA(Asn)/Glu-tRNA(Gln) amidotransferase subunit GatA [Endomicrobium sp.]